MTGEIHMSVLVTGELRTVEFNENFASYESRSSHWKCSVKKGVRWNFCNIHRKTPVPESLFQ